MGTSTTSYPLPQALEPELARLHAHWKDLIRGENSMPFSDDINISQIPDLADYVVLVQAFENPERFRFEQAGKQVSAQYGTPLNGSFSDEVQPHAPLEEFTEQCKATISHRSPTYYRSSSTNDGSYARLLLPTWGEGHVMLLLGAIVKSSSSSA